MKVSRIKNSISYFLLALFLSMKLVGVHALFHNDDKEHVLHCIVCDHALVQDLTPTLAPEPLQFSIENPVLIGSNRNLIINYNFITSNTIASNQLFSRPPPINS